MIATFSIKDLEKLSGIKAHTLRIWELRYGILKPERTDTNIRVYSNDELKQLLNITLLYNHGYKISRIAALKKAELIAAVNAIVDAQSPPSLQEALIIAMVELDEERFEKIISSSILRHGFSQTIETLVYPFLHRIGIMWQTGSINPAQEHFISGLIRQKLIAAIDGQSAPQNRRSRRFILYLPEDELHELSLLYYSYLLRSRGHRVIYLGQSVPFADLQKVAEIRSPYAIVAVFTHVAPAPAYLKKLSKSFPGVRILLSGSKIIGSGLRLPSNLAVFKQPADFLKLIS